MDFETISKLTFGLISSLGTIALVFFNIGQSRKIKAELLEKFEEAVTKKSIHSVTELFRLIHGLRMSYSDIVELIRHDQCSKIIYALKKTPGLVYYNDGEFKYSEIAKNKVFQFIDKWLLRLSISLFSLIALGSLAMLGFGNSGTAIAGFISLIFSSVMLAFHLRQQAYDQMISSLVNSEDNKIEQQPTNTSAS